MAAHCSMWVLNHSCPASISQHSSSNYTDTSGPVEAAYGNDTGVKLSGHEKTGITGLNWENRKANQNNIATNFFFGGGGGGFRISSISTLLLLRLRCFRCMVSVEMGCVGVVVGISPSLPSTLSLLLPVLLQSEDSKSLPKNENVLKL